MFFSAQCQWTITVGNKVWFRQKHESLVLSAVTDPYLLFLVKRRREADLFSHLYWNYNDNRRQINFAICKLLSFYNRHWVKNPSLPLALFTTLLHCFIKGVSSSLFVNKLLTYFPIENSINAPSKLLDKLLSHRQNILIDNYRYPEIVQ